MDAPSGQPPSNSPGNSSSSSPAAAALLREAALRLRAIEAGNPRLEAEYLLAAACGCERIDLFRRAADESVPTAALAAFERLLARRLQREPLQYVLGTVPFCGLDLVIGPGALIPRSETEILVEELARRLAADGPIEPVVPESGIAPPLLIDVGTGSGAILLAALARLPGWWGIGVDRSAAALRWARENRDRLAGRERADLLHGDLLAAVRDGSATAVISNPPYIRSAELPQLAPEIRDCEPHAALDGGADGLEVVRRLLPEAARVLRGGGWLGLELAPDQPERVAELLVASSRFEAVELFRDLAGRWRGVFARRGGLRR